MFDFDEENHKFLKTLDEEIITGFVFKVEPYGNGYNLWNADKSIAVMPFAEVEREGIFIAIKDLKTEEVIGNGFYEKSEPRTMDEFKEYEKFFIGFLSGVAALGNI